VTLGYNALGYNALGYNALGYNELSVYSVQNDHFTTQIYTVITNPDYNEQKLYVLAIYYNQVWLYNKTWNKDYP